MRNIKILSIFGTKLEAVKVGIREMHNNHDYENTKEELRLKYRYLDLRRGKLLETVFFRNTISGKNTKFSIILSLYTNSNTYFILIRTFSILIVENPGFHRSIRLNASFRLVKSWIFYD